MMNYALELKNVSKSLGRRKIIEDLSLQITPGEILGFLGPNGSGKTTTIRMIVGLVKPDGGEIRVGGYCLGREPRQARASLGCIVENPELYSWLTGWENLCQFGVMKGVREEARLKEAAALVGMSRRIHDPVRTYSLGMRQRLGLAVALLAKPKLLILDEPANGLDPAGIAELRVLLRHLAGDGLAVLLSSHLLAEVQQVCDRVTILSQGRLLYSGQEGLANHQVISWQVRDLPRASQVLTCLGYSCSQQQGKLSAAIPRDQLAYVNRELALADVGLELVVPGELAVEELFMQLTGGNVIA